MTSATHGQRRVTVLDIENKFGQRTEEEEKLDRAEINVRLPSNSNDIRIWKSPFWDAKDFKKYELPLSEAGQILTESIVPYEECFPIWQANMSAIQQNKEIGQELDISQLLGGDLVKGNRSRRKHYIRLISYLMQLKQFIKDHSAWQTKQYITKQNKMKAKAKKTNATEAKNNSNNNKKKSKKTKPEIKEDEIKDEIKEVKEEEEPDPYAWYDPIKDEMTGPKDMYIRFFKAAVTIFSMSLCFKPFIGFKSIKNYRLKVNQLRFDAVHMIMSNMARFMDLGPDNSQAGKDLFYTCWYVMGVRSSVLRFAYEYHLQSMINFESKHSSSAYVQQDRELKKKVQEFLDNPHAGRSKEGLMRTSNEIDRLRMLQNNGDKHDHYIACMKRDSPLNKAPKDGEQAYGSKYPLHTYLRVCNELSTVAPEWGITREDYNEIWRQIDNDELPQKYRRIICNSVSERDKKNTADEIPAYRLGLTLMNSQIDGNLGADYAHNAKHGDFGQDFSKLRERNNDQRNITAQMIDADFVAENDFLSKQILGTVVDNDENKNEINDDNKQMWKNSQKMEALMRERQKQIQQLHDMHKIPMAHIEKMLELTDGRATTLDRSEFYRFYTAQPKQYIESMMNPSLDKTKENEIKKHLTFLLKQFELISLAEYREKSITKNFRNGSLKKQVLQAKVEAQNRVQKAKLKYTNEYYQNILKDCSKLEKKLKHKQLIEKQMIADVLMKKQKLKNYLFADSNPNLSNQEIEDKLHTIEKEEKKEKEEELKVEMSIVNKEQTQYNINTFINENTVKYGKSGADKKRRKRQHSLDIGGGLSQMKNITTKRFLEKESRLNLGKQVAHEVMNQQLFAIDQQPSGVSLGIPLVTRERDPSITDEDVEQSPIGNKGRLRTLPSQRTAHITPYHKFSKNLSGSKTLGALPSNHSTLTSSKDIGLLSNNVPLNCLPSLNERFSFVSDQETDIVQNLNAKLNAKYSSPKQQQSNNVLYDNTSDDEYGTPEIYSEIEHTITADDELMMFLDRIVNDPSVSDEHRQKAQHCKNLKLQKSKLMDDSFEMNDSNKVVQSSHFKSASMIIHDDGGNEYDFMNYDEYGNEDEKKYDEVEDEAADFLHGLPFDEIGITFQDLEFLKEDELVPVSKKEMLDPNDIKQLHIENMPPEDTLLQDHVHLYKQKEAVQKLERSFLADDAIKKQKQNEEKVEMKVPFDEKTNEMKDGDEKIDFKLLTEEQKAERREVRRLRRDYNRAEHGRQTSGNIFDGYKNAGEDETYLIDRTVNKWELLPFEDSTLGKQLVEAEEYVQQLIEQQFDIEHDDEKIMMIDDDHDVQDTSGVIDDEVIIDRRQERIYLMDCMALMQYLIDKCQIEPEIAQYFLQHGIDGKTIEIFNTDGELEQALKEIEIPFKYLTRIKNALQFDGWSIKQSMPYSMDFDQFLKWMNKTCATADIDSVSAVFLSNGIDGKTAGHWIFDNEWTLMLNDMGIIDNNICDILRSRFVIDSKLIEYWTAADVQSWTDVFTDVSNIINFNQINGCKLICNLFPVPTPLLTNVGISESSLNMILGMLNLEIGSHLSIMDDIEIYYLLCSHPKLVNIDCKIKDALFFRRIVGVDIIANSGDKLLPYLIKQCDKNANEKDIETLAVFFNDDLLSNMCGFVSFAFIQDPKISSYEQHSKCNRSGSGQRIITSSKSNEEEYKKKLKKIKEQKKEAHEDIIEDAKRKLERIKKRIESGMESIVIGADGKKYRKVHQGIEVIKEEVKIKNFTVGTTKLMKATTREQQSLQQLRKQRAEKRRKERERKFTIASKVLEEQIRLGITEANDIIGIDEEESMIFDANGYPMADYEDLDDDDEHDSEEEHQEDVMGIHKPRMSNARILQKMQIGGLVTFEEAAAGKHMGAGTMLASELNEFVSGVDKAPFHRRRASSIVQRVLEKSNEEYGSKHGRQASRNLSRSVGAHRRALSTGKFVSNFFQEANQREIIEAGMKGEAPLIVYFVDQDPQTGKMTKVERTNVLDIYLDDYQTFDEYIQVLSLRTSREQKKNRNQMAEERRKKEGLTHLVDSLRTKKEEIIRLIGSERSSFKLELPDLTAAKDKANEGESDYERAVKFVEDKFNETKLHLLMTTEFRNNYQKKMNELKLYYAASRVRIEEHQNGIEHLLQDYYTLQNTHTKLEHSLSLLCELNTIQSEVNVRKRYNYQQEIHDLLAMMERYRCRIRHVNRMMEEYEKEVVSLRMQNERRNSEYRKLCKNPTTNRTAATIDYYVAQRKIYESKLKEYGGTYDDFHEVTKRYNKQFETMNKALLNFQHRSKVCDQLFAKERDYVLQKQKDVKKHVEELGLSWLKAKELWAKQGGQNYIQRVSAPYVVEQRYGEEYRGGTENELIEVPIHLSQKHEIHQAFDHLLSNKSAKELHDEKENLKAGFIGKIRDDITPQGYEELQRNFKKITNKDTFGLTADDDETKMRSKAMSILNRGGGRDDYRTPSPYSMNEDPKDIISAMERRLQSTIADNNWGNTNRQTSVARDSNSAYGHIPSDRSIQSNSKNNRQSSRSNVHSKQRHRRSHSSLKKKKTKHKRKKSRKRISKKLNEKMDSSKKVRFGGVTESSRDLIDSSDGLKSGESSTGDSIASPTLIPRFDPNERQNTPRLTPVSGTTPIGIPSQLDLVDDEVETPVGMLTPQGYDDEDNQNYDAIEDMHPLVQQQSMSLANVMLDEYNA